MIVLWEKSSCKNAAEFVRTEPFPGSAGKEVVVPGAEMQVILHLFGGNGSRCDEHSN